MTNESKWQLLLPTDQREGTPPPTRLDRHRLLRMVAGALAVSLWYGVVAADEGEGNGATELRQFIDQQVGGLHNLQVPARNEDIPLPRQADGTVAYRYQTTEAKRYLGKLLFHDPVRTARVNINKNVNPPIRKGEPRDLPEGTAFGGTVNGSDPDVENVVASTRNTASCTT